MGNTAYKSFRESENTNFMLDIFFFINHDIHEKMLKIFVQLDKPQITK